MHLRSCKSFDCVKSKETDVKPKHEKREKRPAVRPQHGRDTGGRLGRLLMHTMTLCVLSGLLKSMKMEETILSTFQRDTKENTSHEIKARRDRGEAITNRL